MAVILYTHALTKLSMYTFTTKVMYNIVLHSKQFRLVFGKQIKVSYHMKGCQKELAQILTNLKLSWKICKL